MNTIAQKRQEITMEVPAYTIGLDLGDRSSHACVLDANGEVIERRSLPTTAPALSRYFGAYRGARVVLEVGTHSPWIARLLTGLGLEVIVANPRKVRLIGENHCKDDPVDAELLARLGRVDPKLLYPVQHRTPSAQADLALLNSRDALVRSRTALINCVRGQVKTFGTRLPSCSAQSFARRTPQHVPSELAAAIGPLINQIAQFTAAIRAYDRQIEHLCNERYPETARLRQVQGVGSITALAYVLTLEDPARFSRSRKVGAFLGLVSRRHDSSQSRPQLRITKAGDEFLRRLLVTCAHYILGPFAPPDTTLRRYGEAIAKRGGKAAKKRAVVAVARKLAVLLHRLWSDGQDYDPQRGLTQAA